MSYQIALSALQAINSQLDTISQNIANTGTTGYKSSRTNFSAMYSSSAPNGVRASSTTQTLDMSGGLLSTGRNLDVAIAGKGYFMVKDSTGVMNYTRGVFDVDKQGVWWITWAARCRVCPAPAMHAGRFGRAQGAYGPDSGQGQQLGGLRQSVGGLERAGQ
jgi:hypothetical protein